MKGKNCEYNRKSKEVYKIFSNGNILFNVRIVSYEGKL